MFNLKVLCLGNNSSDTDVSTSILAKQDNTVNHGLLERLDQLDSLQYGYYHTTILDISPGNIVKIADQFDRFILLDQPKDQWSHWKILLSSYKLMKELESQNRNTVFRDNNNVKNFLLFDNMVQTNKSFCIYPWIEKTENNGYLVTCARSYKKITTREELKDWRTDPEYQKIRQAMLRGEKLPEHCAVCYDYEDKNIESYRQFETKDWISKLEINSLEDLDAIDKPYHYEIRLSNKCNLMCRGCRPEHSHLIEREFRTHKIIFPGKQTFKYSSLDICNIDDLSKKSRVYLTGGEPTVMAEVLEFMRECIKKGKTDFDFTLGTNGQKITPTFLELCDHFTNMNFSISLDGYGRVNDYWRHGSDWDTVIKNTKLLQSCGHNISINTVPGIYNVTNLHLLFEFLDQEFPLTTVYLQINHSDFLSAYNHPYPELVMESMEKCKQTAMYHADGKSNKTCIDSIYDYYAGNPTCDLAKLKEFFEYNDRLDQARNMYLRDYIPELEQARSLVS